MRTREEIIREILDEPVMRTSQLALLYSRATFEVFLDIRDLLKERLPASNTEK